MGRISAWWMRNDAWRWPIISLREQRRRKRFPDGVIPTTLTDVQRENPEAFKSPEWFFTAPGGETYEQVMVRVSDWLAEQSAEPERRLIVVSHGIAGRLLRGAYAGLSRDETLAQDVPQDALYRLTAGQIDRLDCEPVEEPAC